MRLDETDQRLIELLRGDSRLPAATLGPHSWRIQRYGSEPDRSPRAGAHHSRLYAATLGRGRSQHRAGGHGHGDPGGRRARSRGGAEGNPCGGRDPFHQRAVGFGRRHLYDGFGQLGPHYQSHPGNPGSDALGNEHPAERALGIVVSRAVTDGLIILGRVCEGGPCQKSRCDLECLHRVLVVSKLFGRRRDRGFQRLQSVSTSSASAYWLIVDGIEAPIALKRVFRMSEA